MSEKEKKGLPADAEGADIQPAAAAEKGASKQAKPVKKDKDKSFQKASAAAAKWFRELKSELKKIVWPSRKQVVNNTAIVISVIVVAGIFVMIVDWVFEKGVLNQILRLVTGY